MRIAQVIPSLSVGGAERMAAVLALELVRLGHEVSILSLFDPVGSWIEAELRAAGVRLTFLGKRPGLDVRMIPRLARVLATFKPDIVHTHLHTLKYVLPALVGRRKCAVVHTVHNLAEHEIERSGQLFQHAAFRLGVAPVAIGEAVAASIQRVYGLPACAIIPNGIPVAMYRSDAGVRAKVRLDLSLPEACPVFLAVGRLNEQKDHAALIDAFGDARVRRMGARLLIAGDGELRGALERKVEELDLSDSVRFLGVRNDVPQLLAAADAIVLSSRWEGNPLVVMEAMAAGRPVVATAVGCVPELVPAGAGVLVPPGDAAAFADAIFDLSRDLDAARRMGAAAAIFANERFDVAGMASAYSTLFASIVGAARADGAAC